MFKFCNKRIFVFISACLLVLAMSLFPFIETYAASIMNNCEGEELFAVPDGGWSYIKYEVSYKEDYTYNTQTGLNDFTSRWKTMIYMATGATSRPYIILGNVRRSNDIYTTQWTQGDLMFSSDWDYGATYFNLDKITHAVNSPITAKLAFLVVCEDANSPTRAGSVDVYLATE